MQKKIKYENDIIWAQSPPVQGKNGDITVISWISQQPYSEREQNINNVKKKI